MRRYGSANYFIWHLLTPSNDVFCMSFSNGKQQNNRKFVSTFRPLIIIGWNQICTSSSIITIRLCYLMQIDRCWWLIYILRKLYKVNEIMIDRFCVWSTLPSIMIKWAYFLSMLLKFNKTKGKNADFEVFVMWKRKANKWATSIRSIAIMWIVLRCSANVELNSKLCMLAKN